jgi:hypothetical protein
MDCRQCAENLTAYLDGELGRTDLEQVRDHLGTCSACADGLRSLQESAEFIESHVQELTPQPELWNMVRARISATDSFLQPRHFMLLNWRFAAAVVVTFAILGIGYIQYQRMEQKSLDQYISRYIKEREARGQKQVLVANNENNQRIEIPYEANPFLETGAPLIDNPFMEANPTVFDNPFRSEER